MDFRLKAQLYTSPDQYLLVVPPLLQICSFHTFGATTHLMATMHYSCTFTLVQNSIFFLFCQGNPYLSLFVYILTHCVTWLSVSGHCNKNRGNVNELKQNCSLVVWTMSYWCCHFVFAATGWCLPAGPHRPLFHRVECTSHRSRWMHRNWMGLRLVCIYYRL